MSLWNKPPDAITFADIDAFLTQKQREGLRLDYKADMPKDLPKLVAAFANTNGGLIILGVEADPKTNQPNWPSSPGSMGLPSAKGIEERITASCRDNITPPILPLISPIIPNPHLPDKVLVVVRVDESHEAPHSVNGGRHIYERTGSQGTPYEYAHIDRIQHLLTRRTRIEAEREGSIQRGIERSLHQLTGRRLHYIQPSGILGPDEGAEYWMNVPLRWVSVIPVYPWRDLCSGEVCYKRHHLLPYIKQVQRAPGGSYGMQASPQNANQCHGRSMLTTKGHFFSIELAYEAAVNHHDLLGQERKKPEDFWLSFDLAREFLHQTIKAAAAFYGGNIEIPGYLQVSVGFLDARRMRMYRALCHGEQAADLFRGARFPDDSFRADLTVQAIEFLKEPAKVTADLLDNLAYGFDLPPLPRTLSRP